MGNQVYHSPFIRLPVLAIETLFHQRQSGFRPATRIVRIWRPGWWRRRVGIGRGLEPGIGDRRVIERGPAFGRIHHQTHFCPRWDPQCLRPCREGDVSADPGDRRLRQTRTIIHVNRSGNELKGRIRLINPTHSISRFFFHESTQARENRRQIDGVTDQPFTVRVHRDGRLDIEGLLPGMQRERPGCRRGGRNRPDHQQDEDHTVRKIKRGLFWGRVSSVSPVRWVSAQHRSTWRQRIGVV